MTVMAEQWIDENDLDVKVVCYNDFGEQGDAIKNGEIDMIVQTINNVLNMSNIDIVSKAGEEPYYLAVSKNSEELLEELNNSLCKIISIDPFVLQNLQYKNFGANLLNKTLSEGEKLWVADHKNVIIGYLDNYLPYSATDKDGNATGLMTDVFDAILKSLGLENELVPEYRAYDSYGEMIDALKAGETYAAFPVYGNLWNLEQNGINASSEVVLGSETFVYKGSYMKEDVKKLAANRNNNMQIAACERAFTDAKIIECSSIDECLKMVLNRKCDGTIINTLRTEIVTRNTAYDSLSYFQLEINESRCFGVNEGDAEFLTILNRGLRDISSSFGVNNAYKYTGDFYEYTAIDFLRDNITWVVIAIGVIAFIIIMLLVGSLERKADEVRQKEESIRRVTAFNKEIESLKDKADRANEAKTLFLNNMSHDIRTPMNAIVRYTDIARKKTEDTEVQKCLDKIRDSSEHLLGLINDVLTSAESKAER